MKKSKYSKEFKDSTVQLIIKNNESVVKVAQDLDINEKSLYSWVSTYKKAHNIPIKSINIGSSSESLDEENKRLRRELKIAKEERDILKKATAYFAKETL
ncbi:MAG: transposase [Campylobacteraceae bacterium]|nr:transposase [Campylobacteraceae bacterium]